jgi:saccharopine dehydrogenase-like NADP-dependent oxidoreductase
MHDEILIVGGYGQVGRVVAERLGRLFPGLVVAAGRNLERAEAFACRTSGRVRPRLLDATVLREPDAALGDARVVVMCVDQPNAGFARACLSRGVHYVDVTATYRLIQEIEALDDVARAHGTTAVLSVGLAPGVTNLLAACAAIPFERIDRIDLYVLLGLGDVHGIEAVRWMLETAARSFTLQTPGGPVMVEGLSDPKATLFPKDYGRRITYRLDFSDQHVLRPSLGAAIVESRVCFDSAWATSLFVVLKRLGVLDWMSRLHPRVLGMLSGLLRWGSDAFVVQAEVQGLIDGAESRRAYAFSGHREAAVTGIVAAVVAERLYSGTGLERGVYHIEQVFDAQEVLADLEAEGYDVHQGIPCSSSGTAARVWGTTEFDMGK